MLTDAQKNLLKSLSEGWRLYTTSGAMYMAKGKESKVPNPKDVACLIEECALDPVGAAGRVQWVLSGVYCTSCFVDPCSCQTASSTVSLGGAP